VKLLGERKTHLLSVKRNLGKEIKPPRPRPGSGLRPASKSYRKKLIRTRREIKKGERFDKTGGAARAKPGKRNQPQPGKFWPPSSASPLKKLSNTNTPTLISHQSKKRHYNQDIPERGSESKGTKRTTAKERRKRNLACCKAIKFH